MNTGHLVMLFGAFLSEGAIAIAGLLILTGEDIVSTSCTTTHSSLWGAFVLMIAMIALAVTSVVAWDELS
jgi:hypothetical protein